MASLDPVRTYRLASLVHARWPGRRTGDALPYLGHGARAELVDTSWLLFEDDDVPYAAGLRIVGSPFHEPVYKLTEWYGAEDLRRTRWKWRGQRWRALDLGVG